MSAPAPVAPPTELSTRLDRTSGGHRGARRAAGARGPGRPVDARRQPDQVAPGPHHLVLRDLRARPRTCPATGPSTPATATSSTRTTRRSARGTRGRARPDLPADRRPRSAPTAPRRRTRSARSSTRRHATRWRRVGPLVELGPAPRAAAPGAAAHGHQARAVPQPAAPGLRAERDARAAGRARSEPRLGRASTGGIVEVGHDGDGFAFDNEGPRHDVLLRAVRASPTGS